MNKLLLLPIIGVFGVSLLSSNSFVSVNAESDVPVTSISVAHKDGYDILVGEEVSLSSEEFIFTPSDVTNKNVSYYVTSDSFTGNLPPAMFSSESTNSNIIVKGLMVGNFTFTIMTESGSKTDTATFNVHASLPSTAQRDGISVVRTPEENGVAPGTDSLYKNESTELDNKPTPLYVDGQFVPSSIGAFLSQIIDVKMFVVLGIVVIGLMFIYILIYSIKKAIFKSNR